MQAASLEVVTLPLGWHSVNKKMQVLPPTNKRYTQRQKVLQWTDISIAMKNIACAYYCGLFSK